MPSTSGFDFSGLAAGLGGRSTGSIEAESAAQVANSDNNNPLTRWWYGTNPDAERRDIEAFNREQQSAREAREWEKEQADTAWQRKVSDLVAAGFSPLAALDATGQGAAVATSQVARSSTSGDGGSNFGSILGALIAAIGLVVSKGASAAASAKNAVALEGIKQGNREALAKIYSKAAMARATVKKGRHIAKGPYGYIEDIFYGV